MAYLARITFTGCDRTPIEAAADSLFDLAEQYAPAHGEVIDTWFNVLPAGRGEFSLTTDAWYDADHWITCKAGARLSYLGCAVVSVVVCEVEQ